MRKATDNINNRPVKKICLTTIQEESCDVKIKFAHPAYLISNKPDGQIFNAFMMLYNISITNFLICDTVYPLIVSKCILYKQLNKVLSDIQEGLSKFPNNAQLLVDLSLGNKILSNFDIILNDLISANLIEIVS